MSASLASRLARPSLAFLVALLFASLASAQAPAPVVSTATPDVVALRKLLSERFPGAEIGAITRTAYLGGLYEVQFDDRLVYTDAKANHVLVGALWDTIAKTNLTDDRLRKLNRVAWDSLPLELAIKKVKGKGERKLVVFSDADCPFCHKLEEEMKGLDNVTVYTFLFPIDQLHPQAAQKSKQIWCSADPVKAWDDYFVTGKVPDNKGDCKNPVAATQALGQKLRISATPTMILADGSVLPGALPLARLEAEMKQAESEAKKLAKK